MSKNYSSNIENYTSADIELKRIMSTLSDYVTALGGYFEVPKGDTKYNSLNLEIIKVIKQGYGSAYMGHMANHFKNEGPSIDEIFTEYNGQNLSPFCCEFVVPSKDIELEKLVECWNESPSANGKVFRKILKRVNSLGGILLSWA